MTMSISQYLATASIRDDRAIRPVLEAMLVDITELSARLAEAVADITELRTELAAAVVDLAAIRTGLTGTTAQLDADGTVTDTDYAANNDPAALTASAPAAQTSTAPAVLTTIS